MLIDRSRHVPTLLAFGLISWSLACSAERSEEKILAEIAAIEVSPMDKSTSPAESAQRQALIDRKAGLIQELYKKSPTNQELFSLMPELWRSRPATKEAYATTRAEFDEILQKNANPSLVYIASYTRATMAVDRAAIASGKEGSNLLVDDALSAVEDFLLRFPTDKGLPQLLSKAALASGDEARMAAFIAKVKKEHPDSPAAKMLAMMAQSNSAPEDNAKKIGQPFVLEFTDAIKGSPVSIEGLKGKVVVIDFWATWCGPCVAEMPNMKKLYAEYKDKGVEFIGVSLDQAKERGGLDALKGFVAKNQIEWPQYYQGNFWQSEFSSSWNINSIPCVFLVDADGKLASVNARGRLEKLIPEYIEKAKKLGGTSTASAH